VKKGERGLLVEGFLVLRRDGAEKKMTGFDRLGRGGLAENE